MLPYWRIKIGTMRRVVCAILGLMSAAAVRADGDAAQRTRLEQQYARTLAAIDRKCDWQFCRGRRVERLWSLAGKWVSEYLDVNDDCAARCIEKAFEALDGRMPHSSRDRGELEVSALSLAGDDFALTLQYGEVGTVFIVGRIATRHAVKWSITSSATDDELACWRPRSDCGPMYGALLRLPDIVDGERRFVVDANVAGNGFTVGAQTSIWSWNGHRARLLAVDEHAQMIDDPRDIELRGDLLVVPEKEQLDAFLTGGSSPDPRGEWTAQLTASGAVDRGHRWFEPEVRWANEFFAAVENRRSTERLAAPEVRRTLDAMHEEFGGFLFEYSVASQPAHTLRLVLEQGTFTFTFDAARKDLYAIDVKIEPEASGS